MVATWMAVAKSVVRPACPCWPALILYGIVNIRTLKSQSVGRSNQLASTTCGKSGRHAGIAPVFTLNSVNSVVATTCSDALVRRVACCQTCCQT